MISDDDDEDDDDDDDDRSLLCDYYDYDDAGRVSVVVVGMIVCL